jgi:ADP-ribose pyrophosphatase
MMDIAETVIGSERKYEGKIINLRVDTVRLPNGKTATREVIEHSGAIAAVPMLADGSVILVRQFRLPAGGPLLEIPAGGMNAGEDIEECVKRELQEEIGYTPAKVRRLCSMFVAPGYTTEVIHVCLATELSPQKSKGDDDEFIQIIPTSLDEALAKIDGGEIRDGKSIAGLLAVARLRSLGQL